MLIKLRSRALLRDTVTTSGWVLLGKGAGFLVPFFVAAWFGVTGETDAFFFSYGLILFFTVIFSPVVENVIVPYVVESRGMGEDEAGSLVGNILAVCCAGLTLLAGLMLLIMRPVLSFITSFDKENLALVYRLFAVSSPLIMLAVATSVIAGTLNAYKKFAFPAVAPGFRAVVTILFIFAFKEKYGVYSIALGYVLGEAFRFLVLLFILKYVSGFSLRMSLRVTPPLRDFFSTSSFQLFGMVAASMNPVVDRIMAAWLEEGSVSVLHYADRLNMVPLTLLTGGFLNPLLSHWSEKYYKHGKGSLDDDVRRIIRRVAPASLLVTVLLMAFHSPIAQLAFGRGAFGEERLIEVGLVWACYLLGFWACVLGRVYMRSYLVLKKTKFLMQISFFSVILNILFNVILMKYLGIYGLALSTSLNYFFIYLFMRHSFSRSSEYA